VRRLGRILASGPRCGVHTLLIAEPSRPISKSVPGLQLEGQCNHLAWREGTFVWKSSPFEPFALRLSSPPETAGFIRILERVGQAARDAKRVEVPFDVVLPPRDQWWSRDSRDGIRVPLGRVGANRLQQLDLGRGTAQHVLIAGKTGSGKSTLLNVLITSLSFHYSPDQVELYLVDFKKGVEFKAYAAHDLPHARVIAVESDREFGLSVLERLDAEIQRRGEAFRKHRVQDLAAYREATGPGGLPRILLIVDEFQEFFVEDDRIAQDAALLLDRLVRQGRAFGIHVLLGSQTVSGAYSLARSTLSQMAVRIALECSETDAHLILNEDNTAAALLARPGEAIYNDAGGLVDGNSPFQTAWLSDAAREGYLTKLRELARQRNYLPPTPQVVFEGNVPADVTANRVLARLLGEPNGSAASTEHRAWLGDAVAIKEPTSVVFRTQSGSNLLIVGQQAEGALSIMATTLISLAAGRGTLHPQNGAAAARFYLLDGSSADGPAHRFFKRLADVVPFPCVVVGARDLARVLGEVAADVEGRQQGDEVDGPDVYVFLYDIGRFRDLRRSDDDLFSTSSDDEPAKPADLLAAIVRDGPPVGVHTLVWCDSMSNLNRTLDRAGLREFDSTVLFQMSADDSSSLIDSPSANKLGVGRALVYSEEQGTLEKFRPYALPTDDWLERVREQFRVRV
jgi:energy-coupling factor transporter ATP-binding protein EcfA2